MKLLNLIRKYQKPLVLLIDVSIVPGIFIARFLTTFMLSTNRPCPWTLFGLQCFTCGGTRCVSNLVNGNILEAIKMNPFIFACIVYAAITLVLLNFLVFGKWNFPRKALSRMYSLWALVVFFCASFGVLSRA